MCLHMLVSFCKNFGDNILPYCSIHDATLVADCLLSLSYEVQTQRDHLWCQSDISERLKMIKKIPTVWYLDLEQPEQQTFFQSVNVLFFIGYITSIHRGCQTTPKKRK